MALGGARPGAGKPPTRLNVPIDFDGTGKPVTITERVVETLRAGGFIHDAAARIGFPRETLSDWRKLGQRTIRDIVQGRKRSHELTDHERECVVLAREMEKAEADAKVWMLGKLHDLGAGMKRTETTTRTRTPIVGETVVTEAAVVVETTIKEITAVPDVRALTWLLEHRFQRDFGMKRIELSGPEGGPIAIETESAVDKLREAIAAVQATKAETDDDLAALGADGNGTNGHHG